ncbi:NAD-dependent succinate-semialdehyde dehydrogenase [Rhodococcus sp. 06-156-3C]|uniref:NAD-dependent succinate-semialdehyde dehydrogenase n=1 Tax=Nocardiaceae TaxID=85025 RepID=UPI000522EE34|nr:MULTISPECIES: NAD-dependent succinate-semialdehyde dehydrogenase [Rhodococcus]OZD12802.1 NAD-dependent succinate-semialdehyde dehydrogenase [Rhodococcus sp. 06-156-4C]OZD24426.1 NAD-dependent succinate-semialdehyde dehydrogenase [Rhodococcus sp. 06-156-3C]OZD27536.1 NAD-dependent succinate-semialdehyde dehydrogenase [Rhodococcus sp. 06-156-4a]OZD37300.1 NAD-dependent succinate-semialdehyde dehydrogenase [Rhodococcus sp. 06-156-3b]OZD41233.1 NAD-dependent succinate-semialdehyde dehydrogenase
MTTSLTRPEIDSPTQVFIGGHWRDAHGGKTFDVVDPATGETIATVADGGVTDAEAAMAAASEAQKSWAQTAPRERSIILRRAFELIVERTEKLAAIITAEMGKPLADARGEVAYGAEFFRWFSEEAVRISGDHTLTGDGKNRIIVTREPVGPCILVTPWNFPLAMGTRKIGPALAAGCTVVFKPAEQTPLTALALAAILVEAGVPDGVVNVVPTTDAASVVGSWMASGDARKISFTGSTEVGKILLAQAAPTVMRTSMELGGNAPFVVAEGADVDRAVDGAMVAKMRNMGEACTAANRFFVHRSVAIEFAEKLGARMDALNVGPGDGDGVEVGPLIDEDGRAKVQRLVDDALERGARAVVGGAPDDGPGYFYPPTVLDSVDPASDLMSTEIFGPVAAVVPYDTEDEVIALANDTEWGLVGYVFTQDIDRALRMGERLEVGMVGLNTGLVSNPAAPFGGVKQSGLGREGGRVGIDEFLEYKYFAIPRS